MYLLFNTRKKSKYGSSKLESESKCSKKTQPDSRSSQNSEYKVPCFSKTNEKRIFGTRIWIESSRTQLVTTARDTAAVALPHILQDGRCIIHSSKNPSINSKGMSKKEVLKRAHIKPSSAQLSSDQQRAAQRSGSIRTYQVMYIITYTNYEVPHRRQ